jgi:hypothetical protein
MTMPEKTYPDISDILQRKAQGRLDLHARTFGEKLDALDALRARAAPLRAARAGRHIAEDVVPSAAPSQDVQRDFAP